MSELWQRLRRGGSRLGDSWGEQLVRSPLQVFLAILAVAVVVQLTQDALRARLVPDLGGVADVAVSALWLPLLLGVLLWRVIVGPLRNELEERMGEMARREADLTSQAERLEFDTRLHRALEMADDEIEVLDIVEHGMGDAAPGRPVELLLADNSDAHLRRVAVRAPDDEAPGCTVEAPQDCPAVRQGSPMVFESSEELDACPKLRGRPYGPCAATCVPVALMGRAVGVLHAIRPVEETERPENTDRLRSLAARTGARIEMMRVLADTQLQAATDPLTGLINRRSLETHFRELPHDARPITAAMCDLDHFKDLNDTHGHETGDRALRQFARVLRAALRPGDVAARFGGEEFVLLLPRCSADTARQVAQRVRQRLADSLDGGLLPTFTVSIGLADTSNGDGLDELIAAADAALYEAKAAGRDRVVVNAASETSESPGLRQVP